MFVAALTLLCLVCASHSAPLSCDDLVRPVDRLDLRHLEGRWALVAGSKSHLPDLEKFKLSDSAAIKVSSNTSDTHLSYSRSIRLENKCLYQTHNITLDGSSFTFDGTLEVNLTGSFVHTSCPDCMLMRMDMDMESGKRQHFYLFSRRREVEQKEMEEFRAQVECLNMPPPVVKDPTKDLCPEEPAEDPTAQTEEKTEGQNN